MEPTFSTFTIDKEIIFKKSNLEPFKESGSFRSHKYTVCKITGVKHYITIYPNGSKEQQRGNVWAFLRVHMGDAKSVDADIDCCIESANFSKNVKKMYMRSVGHGIIICLTDQFFEETSNYFVDKEMTVKIKGTLKIYLPDKIIYPISGTWRIYKYVLEKLKTSTDDTANCYYSENIKVSSDSDIEYYLVICPNGNREERRGQARIFLHLEHGNSGSKIKAVFNFAIDSAAYSLDIKHMYDSDEEKGYGGRICSTEDLFNVDNRYFIDGRMTVTVSGTLMINKEREPTILSLEKGIVQKGYHRGKNFTFFIGDKYVKVHKHVLKAASPVFAAMFDSKMKEAIEKQMIVVDFEYEIVHAAMKLLYSAALPPTFCFEQMLSLLQFSDKYDIQLIKDVVENYFIKRISPTNVCSIINFTSTSVNTTKLHFKCMEYLIECMEYNKPVHDLDTLDKDIMVKLLRRNCAKKIFEYQS